MLGFTGWLQTRNLVLSLVVIDAIWRIISIRPIIYEPCRGTGKLCPPVVRSSSRSCTCFRRGKATCLQLVSAVVHYCCRDFLGSFLYLT